MNKKTLVAMMICAAISLIALASPPSGRPPVGPLERYEPRVYDFRFSVTLQAEQGFNSASGRVYGRYELDQTPIVLPLVHLGAFHRIDADSLSANLWLQNREVPPNAELKTGYPHNQTLATLHINDFIGQQIRWQVGYRVQVWSSRIDDEAAAKIPWPEQWADEVKDGLAPQPFIESDDPIFVQAVKHVSQGKLRDVPPYLAAKDLVRYCVREIQVTGDGLATGALHSLIGMELWGASEAARRKLGTPHDLVAVCVATLRAAGIPARPVIGAIEDRIRKRTVLTSWGEFYLPDAGWVPFDPMRLRDLGVRTLNVRQAWEHFGHMEHLNRRIPLSYHFMPPADVYPPRLDVVNEAIVTTVWGWDPKPGGDPTGLSQIQLFIASRGLGSGE